MKYKALLSEDVSSLVSVHYKSDKFELDGFYKLSKSVCIGSCISSVFWVPIYGYSGNIEEVVNFWKFGLYVSFVNERIFGVPVGVLARASYGYVLDYMEVFASVELYSYDRIGGFEYSFVLSDIGMGVYTTKFVPIKVFFVPLSLDIRLGYYVWDFKFLGGVTSEIDIEYMRVLPAFKVGLAFVVLEKVEIGVNNTFRLGNALNLEFPVRVEIDKFEFELMMGFGYVNGFSGGIRVITRI